MISWLWKGTLKFHNFKAGKIDRKTQNRNLKKKHLKIIFFIQDFIRNWNISDLGYQFHWTTSITMKWQELIKDLNSAGMNLNWARIKLREKENQLSSWYDRGPLNSVIIFRKRHNISERYDFGTRSVTIFRKDIILVRENILKSDLKMLCFYDFMFRWILPAFIFCWQDLGVRQTDI